MTPNHNEKTMHKKIMLCPLLFAGLALSGAESPSPSIPDKDAADLAKVTAFVHKQLKKTGIIENPDSIVVKFASEPIKIGDGFAAKQRYDKKTYAITKTTIKVPRSLLAILADKENDQAFQSDEAFAVWFNAHIGHTHNKPAHVALYQRSIITINNEELYNAEVEGNLAKARSLIHEQRIENYRRAKATIDHEATHIKENHPLRKLFFNQNAALFAGGPALGALGFIMGNNNFWSKPSLASLIKIPVIAGTSFGAYYLMKQSFSRACELEADAGIRPKPSVLRAKADYHRHLQSTSTQLSYRYAIANLLATHPLGGKRALLMEQRADFLEKER